MVTNGFLKAKEIRYSLLAKSVIWLQPTEHDFQLMQRILNEDKPANKEQLKAAAENFIQGSSIILLFYFFPKHSAGTEAELSKLYHSIDPTAYMPSTVLVCLLAQRQRQRNISCLSTKDGKSVNLKAFGAVKNFSTLSSCPLHSWMSCRSWQSSCPLSGSLAHISSRNDCIRQLRFLLSASPCTFLLMTNGTWPYLSLKGATNNRKGNEEI